MGSWCSVSLVESIEIDDSEYVNSLPKGSRKEINLTVFDDMSRGLGVHVCHSGTCRRYGSEALLVEIEELASALQLDTNCQNRTDVLPRILQSSTRCTCEKGRGR